MRLSRRSFLAASAFLACPHYVRALGANNRLNLAIIGAGGRGAHNTQQLASENIVALCDVDRNAVDKAAQKYPDAIRAADFRRVFDQANRFDAVVVSTTEHTHAFATLPALQLGKHVYCEKPLTYNIHEARVIREAAGKAKVATQMGNQLHASDNFRRVMELLDANVIGPVTEVHVWVSRAWGRQSAEDAERFEDFKSGGHSFKPDLVGLLERPTETMPPPDGVDWELWLGPAPPRPFHKVYLPGPRWYRWWDFANGTMSDLGSHWNDLPFWALKLKAPLTVEAFGPPAHPEIAPASMTAKYTYPARGDMPPVTMTWHQGTDKPDLWKQKKIPQAKNGMLFVGSKGMILAEYGSHKLLPEEQFKGFEPPARTWKSSPGHWAEWVQACKTGSPTYSHFEYAGWLTEANHLGNVAYRAGQKLEWDPVNLKATNCPAAERFIRREYRKGWSLA